MNTNPILRDEEMPRWSMSRPRPVPRADTRLVFTDSRGRTYAPSQPITLGEAVWGNLRHMCEVDMAEHDDSFGCHLPCAEKGFYFDVEVGLSWRVCVPEQIVLDRRTDVSGLYRGYLTGRLMEWSEQYTLEQRAEAERALKAALGQRVELDGGISITRATVALTLGQEAEGHLAERTRARFKKQASDLDHQARLDRALRESAAADAEHGVEMQRGQHRAEHRFRQAGHDSEIDELQRTREQERQLHDLELERRRAEFGLQMETQRNQHQIAMRNERMSMYAKALERGEPGLVVLFLEAHPEDAGRLLDLLRAERRNINDNSMKVLQAMLEARLLDAVDMDDAKRQALSNLFSGMNTGALDALLGPSAIADDSPGEDEPPGTAADPDQEPDGTAAEPPDPTHEGRVEPSDAHG